MHNDLPVTLGCKTKFYTNQSVTEKERNTSESGKVIKTFTIPTLTKNYNTSSAKLTKMMVYFVQ